MQRFHCTSALMAFCLPNENPSRVSGLLNTELQSSNMTSFGLFPKVTAKVREIQETRTSLYAIRTITALAGSAKATQIN